MLFTFGILALMLGGILFAVSLARILFSASRTPTSRNLGIVILISSAIVLFLAVLMIHEGKEESSEGIHFGVLLLFTGMLIALLGSWMGFWGPLARRNSSRGLTFIILGVGVMVVGILIMSGTELPSLTLGEEINDSSLQTEHIHHDLDRIFGRSMGSITFGMFCIVFMVMINGIVLLNRLRFGRAIGTNLLAIAILVFIYGIGDTLFPGW